MKTSDSINELAEALAKAQGEIKPAPKDADNPFFKSRYATLDSCWQSIRQPLAKNGLAVIQAPGFSDGVLTLTTRLTHSSGQWIETTLGVVPDGKNPVQAMGSAITYLRRYSLALIGVTTEEDDDANATGETQPAHTNGKQSKPDNNPEWLLGMLNKVKGIEGYYKHREHLWNALKKENDAFEWPAPDDTDSWRETFVMARDRAKAMKATEPQTEQEPLFPETEPAPPGAFETEDG